MKFVVFEKFSAKSIKIVLLSNYESELLHHGYVSTEQLLLALVAEKHNVVADVFEEIGISHKTLRAEVKKIIGTGESSTPMPHPFTKLCKTVIEDAVKTASEMGDGTVEAEHLFLAILDKPNCVALQVLNALNADVTKLRSDVLNKCRRR